MSSITMDEAERIARVLFPDDIADGQDCRNMVGQKGQPCPICADPNETWQAKIKLVCDVVNNKPTPVSR